jgi:hypothetical protein
VGSNYFGQKPDYVPRQSLTQYKEWLDDSLASLKSIEDQHKELYAELKTKKELTLNLAKCASIITKEKNLLEGQKNRVATEMQLAVSAIAAAATVIANAKEATGNALNSYAIAVRKLVSYPDADKLLGMLEMLAFAPAGPQGALMAGTQAGKFINTLVTTGEELPGGYKKEYVVGRMESLGEEFRSLDDDAIKIAGDGSLKLANEPKLLDNANKAECGARAVLQ